MTHASDDAATDTRERILSCAETLFGAKGYDSVAVADIAQTCGVSTGLIYYHYRDKESLLRALVERAEEILSRPAIQALESTGASARERLEAFAYTWVHAALDHRSLVRILVRPFSDPEGPLASELQEMATRAIGALAGVLEEGVAAGEFDDVDPYLSAECLFALVNTRVVARAINAPHSHFVDKTPDEIVGFICRLYFEGIRPC